MIVQPQNGSSAIPIVSSPSRIKWNNDHLITQKDVDILPITIFSERQRISHMDTAGVDSS